MSDIEQSLSSLLALAERVKRGEFIEVPDGAIEDIREVVSALSDAANGPVSKKEFEASLRSIHEKLNRIEKLALQVLEEALQAKPDKDNDEEEQ